jgi:hypothetical protein
MDGTKMTNKPEEFTDQELEKAIDLHMKLIGFYNQVKFDQDQLPFKAIQEFYDKLRTELQLRKKRGKWTL